MTSSVLAVVEALAACKCQHHQQLPIGALAQWQLRWLAIKSLLNSMTEPCIYCCVRAPVSYCTSGRLVAAGVAVCCILLPQVVLKAPLILVGK